MDSCKLSTQTWSKLIKKTMPIEIHKDSNKTWKEPATHPKPNHIKVPYLEFQQVFQAPEVSSKKVSPM